MSVDGVYTPSRQGSARDQVQIYESSSGAEGKTETRALRPLTSYYLGRAASVYIKAMASRRNTHPPTPGTTAIPTGASLIRLESGGNLVCGTELGLSLTP